MATSGIPFAVTQAESSRDSRERESPWRAWSSYFAWRPQTFSTLVSFVAKQFREAASRGPVRPAASLSLDLICAVDNRFEPQAFV